jgi:hypothetical protein
MKCLGLAAVLTTASGVCVLATSASAQQNTSAAQSYVLNYDVPESPGFVALGVAPSSVTRGSAAKPFTASLVSQLLTGQKLAGGLALDFTPYFVYGGRLKSIEEYRRNSMKRFLANLQVSVATVESETDTSALRLGFGVRATLFDNHDQLSDTTLSAEIDAALSRAADSQRRRTDTSEVGSPVSVPDLKEAYARARDRIRRKPGGALSLGWGVAGVVRGAVANSDSIGNVRHRFWLSYRHTFTSGMDLLATTQWKQADSSGTSLRAGVALRVNANEANLALEMFYDSDPHELSAGRVGLGGNAEWRFAKGVGLMATVATEPTMVSGQLVSKLRVRTSLNWAMNGEP